MLETLDRLAIPFYWHVVTYMVTKQIHRATREHTNSYRTFRHVGAGDQIGWVDQEAGISFGWVTNYHDGNQFRLAELSVILTKRRARWRTISRLKRFI